MRRVHGGVELHAPADQRLDFRELYRQAAVFVDKILKGARPDLLPVERATKFELLINNRAATALGLTIPPSILLRADEIVD
jgi:putative ABC transport system substrate-binding protein